MYQLYSHLVYAAKSLRIIHREVALVALDAQRSVNLLPGRLVDPKLERVVHLVKLFPAGLGQVHLDLMASEVLLGVGEVLVAVHVLADRGELGVVDVGELAGVDGEDVVLLVEHFVV